MVYYLSHKYYIIIYFDFTDKYYVPYVIAIRHLMIYYFIEMIVKERMNITMKPKKIKKALKKKLKKWLLRKEVKKGGEFNGKY